MGTAGAAAWSRWQAFLGCLGFALVPQALALAAVGPAACGAAPAVVGASLGTALTAAVRLPAARQSRTDIVESHHATRKRDSSAERLGPRARVGFPATAYSSGVQKRAEPPVVGQASRPARHGSARTGGDGSENDGEHGLGQWRPFWATVPAWSATLLLMLEPVKLLVRAVQPRTMTSLVALAHAAQQTLACIPEFYYRGITVGSGCRRCSRSDETGASAVMRCTNTVDLPFA